jgi:hypothetical protein
MNAREETYRLLPLTHYGPVRLSLGSAPAAHVTEDSNSCSELSQTRIYEDI